MRTQQKEIQVEDKEEILVVEMEEVAKMFQRKFENDRQDGNWSIQTHVEGRNDTRQES